MAKELDSASDHAKKSELTRRDWLLKVGQAGAVAGIAGVVGDRPAISRPPSTSQPEAALAPGLYEPSNDHLAHALGADALFHPIPAGSETNYRRPRAGPFEPQYFAEQDFKIIGRLVELVLGEPAGSAQLPESVEGGPGSVAADVAAWVDFVAANSSGARLAARNLAPPHRTLAIYYHGREAVERLENSDVEALCREGLAWLRKESKEQIGRDFLALSEREQIELLSEMSDQPNGASAPEPSRKFFRWLKGQVLHGFYRSPAGLKELDFKGNAFYAESPGCTGHSHSGGGKTD
jgi:gluconate 2-dehydrogenase subunit 3-like protein